MNFLNEEIKNKLLDYQIEHTNILINALMKNNVALDSSDTGTGKTYCALAICAQLKIQPLIIAPKTSITTWYQVCELFNVTPKQIVNYETIQRGKCYGSLNNFLEDKRQDCEYIAIEEVKPNGTLATKTIIKIKWFLPTNTILIFDEGHKSKNGLNAHHATLNSIMMSSARGVISHEKNISVLILSATIVDKIENADTICYVLGLYRPHLRRTYQIFVRLLREEVGQSGKVIQSNLSGGNKLTLLHKKIFPAYGSRMHITDIKKISTYFRDNDVQPQIYPVSPELAKTIEAEHYKIQEALQKLREKGLSAGFGTIIRYWQNIEILKIGKICEIADSYLEQNYYLVIFVNFDKTRKLLHDRLIADPIMSHKLRDTDIEFIYGKQNMEERGRIVEDFRDDKYKVLICNMKSGGVSISLHDVIGNHARVSIICPTWSAIDMKQALGRIYRSDAKTNTIQRIVYCTSPDLSLSVEERLCINARDKLHNIEYINNGNLSEFYYDIIQTGE